MKLKLKIESSRKRQIFERLKTQYKRDRKKLRDKIGMQGVQNIRREIDKRHLVKTSDMKNKIDYKLTKDGIAFISGTEYSRYLEKGIRKHIMKYLRKAKAPIPIQKGGEVLFRTPSEKSFKQGKWRHPGFTKGRGFFKTGINNTVKMMKKEIKEIARKTLLR